MRTGFSWRFVAALCLAALWLPLFLTACPAPGQSAQSVQSAPPQTAAAEENPASTPDGFALLEARAAGRGGSALALALEFSQPLLGTQDFDALVHVHGPGQAPERGAWTLLEGNTVLHYPYVGAAKNYIVTISPELLAADGERLGEKMDQKSLQRSIYTGEMQPVASFASQGSVLPARESRGLPVVSVNVAEVDVEFLRVREKDYPKFFANYRRGQSLGAWSLDGGHEDRLAQIADPVYLNRFVLDGRPNERSLNYLPIQDISELQAPGLYFAVLKRSGSFASSFSTAFFTVSDVGLHARAYKDGLFVHAASLASGVALGQVELRILDAKGQPVGQGRTDASGNARLDYRLDAGHVLVARSGKDVTLLPFNQPALDLSEFAVSGRAQNALEVFAWSGRDLYRPGETVRMAALLRDHDGQPLDKTQPVFLRLLQPDGRTLYRARLEPDEQGYMQWEKTVPPDVPTGHWTLELRTDPGAGKALKNVHLRIEEFLPERLKLNLASSRSTLAPGEAFPLQVQAAYLYGAPAAGNRFSAALRLQMEPHPVESLPDWYFGDLTLDTPRERQDVLDVKLDAEGHFSQHIPLPQEASQGSPVAAFVSGSVYESGGRTVSRTIKRVLWPAPALVGLRPLFDRNEGAAPHATASFELRRVNAAGETQPAKGLQLRLVREHRDYHWTWESETWDYRFTRRFETVESRTLDVGGQGAEETVRLDFPVEWGEYRLEIFDPATNLTTRHPFRAGWSWNDANRGLDARPDKIKLALDKTRYRAGETATLTLTPPHPGPGILLVESERLLHVQPIDAQPGSTVELAVTEDWERHDVYITALVFRGGSAPSKITPARAVGVAHVPMDRAARKVAVALSSPEQMRPGQPMQVALSAPELAGQKAHVVVSAVDQGILNITGFAVPDAARHFFARRRLGTHALDIYGRVIESFGGDVLGRLSAPAPAARLKFGGDMELLTLPQARRPTARVQTTDLFSGPVALDAEGKASVALDVPDFNGSLRVSALVYAGGRYGKADTSTQVRAPVLAEASLPRVLAPGDSSTLTLDVQNFTGKEGEFSVQVSTEGPLHVPGAARRQVQLADEARTTLTFPLEARAGHAVAKVQVRVSGQDIDQDIDLRRHYELPVRAAWGSVLRSQTRTLEQAAPIDLDKTRMDGLIADSVRTRLTVSQLPPIPFAAAMEGVLQYPYACAEQTASKAWATLSLDDATATLMGVDAPDEDGRKQHLERAFARLSSMQTAGGHFSMWGGSSGTPQLTPYIAEFLLAAKARAHAIPEDVLQKALKRLSEDLLSGRQAFYGQEHRKALRFAHQAYSGYVLALVGRAPLGTLRTLHDNARGDAASSLALAHLGLALHLQGDARRGAEALAEAFAFDPEKRPRWLGDYGSPERDLALMIALVEEHQLARPEYLGRALGLARDLQARQQAADGHLWLSTQEQMALARLGQALLTQAANGEQSMEGRLTVGNDTQAVSVLRKTFSRDFDAQQLSSGVRFAPGAGSPSPLYVSIDTAGIPLAPPSEQREAIDVERSWHHLDGSDWVPGPLTEGQVLVAQLKITAEHDMPDALVTDLLPAGLEIENLNLTDGKQWEGIKIGDIDLEGRQDAADLLHQEFRDDRYVAALNLRAGHSAHLFYLVRAVTPGHYRVPPPLAEGMYRPQLRGVGKAHVERVVVVPPGGAGDGK